MESSPGDVEESTEDIPEPRKNKMKSIKTRLFRRSSRARDAKLSQSASDIAAGEEFGSAEDLLYSPGISASRALSHDSIFMDDEVLTDPEPTRVLSQENVHSKIKALQLKLQQQKMHLGPPPLVLPMRRPEESSSHLEGDGLRHSSSEMAGGDAASQEALRKILSQTSTRPLPSIPRATLTKCVPPYLSHPSPASAPSIPSASEPPVDFSSPAQSTTFLDTSAARHRVSLKPRNQRASTKKRPATTDSMLNNIDHPEDVEEEEQHLGAEDNVTLETEHGEADISTAAQLFPPKPRAVEPVTLEETTKSSHLTFSQQEPAPSQKTLPVPSQVPRPKPQRPVDATSNDPPHSSNIESGLKSRKDGRLEIQEKRNALKKTTLTEDSSEKPLHASGSDLALRPSAALRRVQEDSELTDGIKKPVPGTGSVHFSITPVKNEEEERPRPHSFVGRLELLEIRHKTLTEDKSSSGLREKDELGDSHYKGRAFTVGRPNQEGLEQAETKLTQTEDKQSSGLLEKEELRDSQPRGIPFTLRRLKQDSLEKIEPKCNTGTEDRSSSSLREKEDLGDSNPRARPFTVGRLKQDGLEPPETKQKAGTEDKSSSSLQEKGELGDSQPRGNPFTVGRLKQEGLEKFNTRNRTEVKSSSSLQENQELKDSKLRGRPFTVGRLKQEGLEQAEAKQKTDTEDKSSSSLQEREELQASKPRGSPFTVGRLKQEGVSPKTSVPPWDKKDDLKKTEPVVSVSKNAAGDTSILAGQEAARNQEEVDLAVEEKEEDAKTAFGIRLRSTAQSLRYRAVCEDSSDKQTRQDAGERGSQKTKKPSTNISSLSAASADVRDTESNPSGLKNDLPGDSTITSAEVQTTFSVPREVETAPTVPPEPQPAPQPASSEVSWMSIAMLKTKSLQQILTSRLPREFTGKQTAARPQAQAQPSGPAQAQAGAQIQVAKAQQNSEAVQTANLQLTDAANTATVQNATSAQTLKPSLVSVQQRMTGTSGPSKTFTETRASSQTSESQMAQYPPHPPKQAKLLASRSPFHSATQTETPSQLAKGSATQLLVQSNLSSVQDDTQQPPWSIRGLQPTHQPKSTSDVSATSLATAPPSPHPSSALEIEANIPEKESSSGRHLGRHVPWRGSVSERAAFLEKMTERATTTATKEVELQKSQTEAQASDLSATSTKITSLSTETKGEGRHGIKPPESTTAKIADRPCDDRWLRKNVACSSSPTCSSSNRGQPSWMEMAKRKSMAWSDKTMD